MHVTIAICTWNRCELLRQTLQRLTEIEVPPDVRRQVLIINNNCSDATDAVATDFAQALNLRIVVEPQPGLSRARNRALCGSASSHQIQLEPNRAI